jgi:hypothetical protein
MNPDLRCLCGDPDCPLCFIQEPVEEYDSSDDVLLGMKEDW